MSLDDDQTATRVLGIVIGDFERAAIGTRSRLADMFAGKPVLHHVVERLRAVKGVDELALLVPPGQEDRARTIVGHDERVRVRTLEPRAASMEARVRTGRAWNLYAWRGGAGQWTAFDEEYHPAAIARACRESFEGAGADHALVVHSHGVFLDAAMTAALVDHHLHKNHEMRITYTPAAPGLCGMALRADIVAEMGEKNVLPWQLLAYDPKAPSFDTLIREACMQVDPALSKIPNRFCVDTQRGWDSAVELAQGGPFATASEMALAAARGVAPGVRDFSRIAPWPREIEIELTAQRLTSPPGSISRAHGTLDTAQWTRWLERQPFCDDLLVTVGGDGDPLLAPDLAAVLRALRTAGTLSICVQTDLAGGAVDEFVAAIEAGLVDVISVTMYGHTAATYAAVAGADRHAEMMRNMERLAEVVRGRGGVPLVVPRLLKVRQTIPEMEAFFDFWIERSGWAVLDGPTDRAGAIPFAAVIDMAPPRRRPCRRLWERLRIRADGMAVACDQDVQGRLTAGNIAKHALQEMWQALNELRAQHAAERWMERTPCATCREWYRP